MLIDHARHRWVHLPVEVQVRGLHARLFLACVAAESGYGAVVGAKARLAAVADRLPRGIYLEKSCEGPAARAFRYRRLLGHVECCLDEEGVVYVDAEGYAARRLSDATFRELRRFFAWGHDQATVVAQYHPQHLGRVVVTGNPRVDLWRPELRAVYDEERATLRAAHGSFVLIASAFAMVNNARGEDFVQEVAKSSGWLDTDTGEIRWKGYLAHYAALFDALSEAAVRLAHSIPDRRVVIRPHPSEAIEHWERVAARARNLIVIREGPVTPWLLAADAVVHSNCTTGLEGFLVGRPTIAYAPYRDDRYDMNLPNAVSQLATTEDDLADLVRANIEKGGLTVADECIAVASAHIAALDGPFAAERLVGSLSTIAAPEERLADSLIRHTGAFVHTLPHRLVTRAARTARGRVRRPDRSLANRPSGKFPGSSLDEVRAFIDRLHDVTGRFGTVVCDELYPDVYAVIEPDL